MLRQLARLRQLLFPTTTEIAQNQFDLSPFDAQVATRGAQDLGSHFRNGIGFTEDTWPLVIVGEFLWCRDEQGPYFDFCWFTRRLILDFKRRTARQEWAWRRKTCELPRVQWRADDIQRLSTQAMPHWDDCALEIELDLSIGPSRYLLLLNGGYLPHVELIASRINYLWNHGRVASNVSDLPPWGHHGSVWRWRNPDTALVEKLL